MAASEMVRLRLQFDYPPPVTPHCTVFWLLVDLNRCRVVTDLISLIRQRFGFSSGAFLGLYLDGGLLPPAESARLVRDNDCLRVKLEDSAISELSVLLSNGSDSHFSPVKAKKRTSNLEEDEETELGYVFSKKHWKRQENSSNHEKASDLNPKAVQNQPVRKKGKRKNKAACDTGDADDRETRRKSPKKEKCEYKKQTKNRRSLKAQAVKERSTPNCGPPKGSAGNGVGKARRKVGGGVCAKRSPSSSSESQSSEASSDRLSKATMEAGNSSEKLSAELPKLPKDGTKNTAANRPCTKAAFNLAPGKGKTIRASSSSSSSSDSSSASGDESAESKRVPECGVSFLKTASLFAGRGRPGPGPSPQTPGTMGWKPSESPVPLPSMSVPTSIGRGWGRGQDLLSWKGARGRGMRGRGRGRGHALPCVLNKNPECQKQQQLSETMSNISTIIQNPVELPKKDYSLLPLLAAAPQLGEKIAFKLLELTSDYSPDVSDYKEGKLLSHNPETQQVDIEILSSLPAVKEPGKFDLVYHNENGTEVVEYAVMQERRITVFWRELIEPRLIIEPPSNTTSSEPIKASSPPHGL